MPNDLDELNQIWNEFTTWEVPSWVKVEIDVLNEKEVYNGQESSNIDSGANIQKGTKKKNRLFSTLSPVILYLLLMLAIVFFVLMIENSIGNVVDILNLLDKDVYTGEQIQQNYFDLIEKMG